MPGVTLRLSFQRVDVLRTARLILDGRREGKALPAAIDRGAPIYGPAGVTRRRTDSSAKRYLGGYGGEDAVDWIYDSINLYAQPSGTADYHFERNGRRLRFSHEDPKQGEYAGVVPSDLEGLFALPNPHFTYGDLLELTSIDLLAAGNAYWLLFRPNSEGKPLAVYRLAPPFITIIPGSDKLVERYEYAVPGAAKPLIFSPDEIIQFKQPNPHDDLYGMGVVAAAPRVYDVELGLVETMDQFFASGAKLSGVLQSDRSVPETIRDRIERSFRLLYSGSQNAYQVAVLERGLTFQAIQPTAAEAQFKELTHLGRDRIFQMFGVHPALVNGDFARPGLVEEAQRYFDNKKLRPFLDKLQERISLELAALWGVQFKIDYQYVQPEKDRLQNATDFASLPGVKIAEVREYAGLPRLGDPRDEIVINLPGITTEQNGGFADKQNPNGGRPPNPNNTAAIDQQLPSGAAARTAPDARNRRRLKKALRGSPADLEVYMASLGDDTATEVMEILNEGKSLRKPDRGRMLDTLDAAGVDGAVVAHVAEGVRRGYSIDQIIEGVPSEDYVAVESMI